MSKAKITLKDIAQRCSVSLGTVSAVINNKSWVSASIRQQVLRRIEELDYHPNATARSLKVKKSWTIGVIAPDITNPFFPVIIRSIDLSARDYGYHIILCDSNEDVELGLESFEFFLSWQVDGIILLGEILPPKKLEYYLHHHALPIVAVECDYGFSQVHTIITDNQQGGYMATNHLLNLGYRSIGMISDYLTTRPGRQRLYGSNERLLGFQAALKEHGLTYDYRWVKEGDHSVEGGRIAMNQFFEGGQIPRAIFATNDMMAIGATEVARENGLNVPADIAIVGYDNIPQASFTSPKLTTIALPKKKIGARAVELLAQQMISGHTQCQKIVMPIRIIVRESCGSPVAKE